MENRYLKERFLLKLNGKKPEGVKRAEKQAKGVYFADQIANSPKVCEECGKSLAGTKVINPAAMIAHILPKSEKQGCPSVALHPLNKFYACIQCHTNFDSKGAEFVQSMKIFPKLVERVSQFYGEIAANERRRVPVYFRPKK